MRLLTHAAALLAGAALTVPAYAAVERDPGVVTRCQQVGTPQPQCQINLVGVDREDVHRFKLRFLIDGNWEYVDTYWPCGDPAVLCADRKRVR